MRLRPFLLAMACGGLITAEPAFCADAPATAVANGSAERLALGRQIVELAFPADKRMDMFSGAIDQLTGQMRKASPPTPDPTVRLIVDGHLKAMRGRMMPILEKHIPQFMDALAHAYAREFSLAELADLRAFAASPAGSHFFARQIALLSDPDYSAANQAYIADILAMLPAEQGALRVKLFEYLSKRTKSYN